MKKVVNASAMREADGITIEMLNGNGIILMEHAATSCVRELRKEFGNQLKDKKILSVAGKGNNGGDAIAIARQLSSLGAKVKVALLSNPQNYGGDAGFQLSIIKNYPVPLEVIDKDKNGAIEKFNSLLNESDIVIDGIFGTGLSKPVSGFYGEIIESINNEFSGFVLSVDIPSGLFADKSTADGIHVKADKTVTFGKLKPCHVLYPACESCGKVIEDWITIPDFVFEKVESYFNFVEKSDIKALKKEFSPDAHKGVFGHAGIIAGERGKLGASILAAFAALKSGCGLSTVYAEEENYEVLSSVKPEIMFYLAKDKGNREDLLSFFKGKSAILLGQGLGTSEKIKSLIKTVLENIDVPIVLDADVFRNYTIDELSPLLKGKQAVLTPHPGEMALFTGFDKKEIAENRIKVAKSVSEKTGAVVILKGYQTVIAFEGKVFVNGTGSNALGTAGSGDVLGGVITSFLSQGYSLLDAALLAVASHGLAGQIAESKIGREGVVAGDIAENISRALNYEE